MSSAAVPQQSPSSHAVPSEQSLPDA